jgi:hypothetical protein
VEYGLGMDLAPRANQFLQTRLGESTWESPRFNPTGKCSRSPQQALFGASSIHAAISAPPKGRRRRGMCNPKIS